MVTNYNLYPSDVATGQSTSSTLYPSDVATGQSTSSSSSSGSVYKTTPSGWRAITRDVFDVQAYERFAGQKQLEAKQKETFAEQQVKQFEKTRTQQLQQEKQARQKKYATTGRITERGAQQLAQTRKSTGFGGFQQELQTYTYKAQKDIGETATKEYDKLNKEFEKINKELAGYKPMKKETYYESSYGYVSPKGKRTSISFESGKKYEIEMKNYQAEIKKQQLAYDNWGTTGGAYVSGTGQLFSSALSPSEINKNLSLGQPPAKSFFNVDYSKTLLGAVSRIKASQPGTSLFGGMVKVGTLYEGKSVLEQRAAEVRAEAKIGFEKDYSSYLAESFSSQQKKQKQLQSQAELSKIMRGLVPLEQQLPKRFTDLTGTYFDRPTQAEETKLKRIMASEEKAMAKGFVTSSDIFRTRALGQEKTPFGLGLEESTRLAGESIGQSYANINQIMETPFIPYTKRAKEVIGYPEELKLQLGGVWDIEKTKGYFKVGEKVYYTEPTPKSFRQAQDRLSRELVETFYYPAKAGGLAGLRLGSYGEFEKITDIEFENIYGYKPTGKYGYKGYEDFTKRAGVKQALIGKGVLENIFQSESSRIGFMGETEEETAKRLGYIGGTLFETAAFNLIPTRGAQWIGNIYEFSREPISGTIGIIPGVGFGVGTRYATEMATGFAKKASIMQKFGLKNLEKVGSDNANMWTKFLPGFEGLKAKGYGFGAYSAKKAIYPLFAAESILVGSQLYDIGKTDKQMERDWRRAFFAQEAGFNWGNIMGMKAGGYMLRKGGYKPLTAEPSGGFGIQERPRYEMLSKQMTTGDYGAKFGGTRGTSKFFPEIMTDVEFVKDLKRAYPGIKKEAYQGMVFATPDVGGMSVWSPRFAQGKKGFAKTGDILKDFYENLDYQLGKGFAEQIVGLPKMKVTKAEKLFIKRAIGKGKAIPEDTLVSIYNRAIRSAEKSGLPQPVLTKKSATMYGYQEYETAFITPQAKYVKTPMGEFKTVKFKTGDEESLRYFVDYEPNLQLLGITESGTPLARVDLGKRAKLGGFGYGAKEKAYNIQQWKNLRKIEREMTRKDILTNIKYRGGYFGEQFPVQPGTKLEMAIQHSEQSAKDYLRGWEKNIGGVQKRISKEVGEMASYAHDFGKTLKGVPDYTKPWLGHEARLAKEIRLGDWAFMKGLTKKTRPQVASIIETHGDILPFRYGVKTGQVRKAFAGLSAKPEQKLMADVDKLWWGSKTRRESLFYKSDWETMGVPKTIKGKKMMVTGKSIVYKEGKPLVKFRGYSLEPEYPDFSYSKIVKGFKKQKPFAYTATPMKYRKTGYGKNSILPSLPYAYATKGYKQPSYGLDYYSQPKYAPQKYVFKTYKQEKYVPYKEPVYRPTKQPTDYVHPTKEPVYTPFAYKQVPYVPQKYVTGETTYTGEIPYTPTLTRTKRKEEMLKQMYAGGTFNAYARKNNNTKWVKVTDKPLPYNSAFNRGLMVADNTTARSVKLKRASKTFGGMDDPFIMEEKFRRRKARSRVPGEETIFIESTPYLIDTQGEKQGLRAAKFMKQGSRNQWAF